MSACSSTSVAPYSALPKPPKSATPSSMVISLPRRSPCEIWWRCRTPSACHTGPTRDASAEVASSVTPRGWVWAYSVHPRSRAANAIVVLLATPSSPMAIAISPRCSTARRIDACSGAVSLLRSRTRRQIWLHDAAAALVRAVHLDDRLRWLGDDPRCPRDVGVVDHLARRPQHQRTRPRRAAPPSGPSPRTRAGPAPVRRRRAAPPARASRRRAPSARRRTSRRPARAATARVRRR